MADGENGSRLYELRCVDCSFTTSMEGGIDEIYDVIDSHRDEKKTNRKRHFVEIESVSA